MEPNKLFKIIVEERREKLKKYLLECNHYDKDRLIRGAKNRGIFADNQDNEQVYHALVLFSKFHKIALHVDPPKIILPKASPENTFIEKIDDEGNVSLIQLGDNNNKKKNNDSLKEVLEKEREELSKRLLKINELLKLYQ